MKLKILFLFIFLVVLNTFSQRTREVNDFLANFSGNPGGDNNESIILDDKLYFTVGTSTNIFNSAYYTRFHYTDGSSQYQIKFGTGPLSRYILGELSSPNYTIFQDQLLFTGRREDVGTSEKYRLVYGPNASGLFTNFIAAAGVFTDVEVLNTTTLYFGGWVDTANIELHKVVRPVGGTAVVTRVTDINTSGSSEIKNLTAFNDLMYFSAFDGTKQELYYIDANDNVSKVSITGETIEDPEELTIVNNKLYFTANDGVGRKLFVIDPSKVTPIIKFDFLVDDANPTGLTAFEVTTNGIPVKLLVMSAFYNTNGKELVIVDTATNINTVSLIEMNNNGDSDPQKFYQYNDNLYFSAVINAGRELYKFDGTTFAPIANINPGTGNSNPNFFKEYQGKLYFNAVSLSEGSELWKLDENENLSIVGGHLINSTASFNPRPMADFAGKLYMSAYKIGTQRELYIMGLETKVLPTADTNWYNESNWDFGVPDEFVNVVIAEDVELDITDFTEIQDLVVTNSLAKINVLPSAALTVKGNILLPLNTSGILQINSNNINEHGTFILDGTHTGGKISYNKFFNDDVGFSGSPFTNSSISTMVANLENLGGNFVGIGNYNNSSTGKTGWEYFTSVDASNANFEEGKGYVIDRDGAGLLSFEGVPYQNDLSVNVTNGTKNGWNLLSNPYTSFLSVVDISNISIQNNTSILENSINALDSNYYAIYYYDASMNRGNGGFNAINYANKYANLAPGQAFFLKANTPSNNLEIKLASQNHGINDSNLSLPSDLQFVTLYLENKNDATQVSSTKIYYNSRQSTFDPKYDAARFDLEGDDEFFIATKLVSDNSPVVGLDYQVQSVYAQTYLAVVPISIKAKAGTEIDFMMEKQILQPSIDVYIEDRENQTFHKLETTTDSFSVSLTNDLNGAGRFYLHTTDQTPLSTIEYDINSNVSMYANNHTIFINGLIGAENSVYVFDILGNKIAEVEKSIKNNLELTLNLSISRGFYFVNIRTSSGVYSKKVFIK